VVTRWVVASNAASPPRISLLLLAFALAVALQQINLRIEEKLLVQFKAAAKARGISANVAAALAFEAWLAGDQSASSSTKQSELADVVRRLEVLEQKLAAMEMPLTAPVTAEAAPLTALPPRRLTHDEARSVLTTRDVAQELGLASDSSLTNWIARNGHDEAIGKVFKAQFLLLGKGLLPGTGKSAWLWRRQ